MVRVACAALAALFAIALGSPIVHQAVIEPSLDPGAPMLPPPSPPVPTVMQQSTAAQPSLTPGASKMPAASIAPPSPPAEPPVTIAPATPAASTVPAPESVAPAPSAVGPMLPPPSPSMAPEATAPTPAASTPAMTPGASRAPAETPAAGRTPGASASAMRAPKSVAPTSPAASVVPAPELITQTPAVETPTPAASTPAVSTPAAGTSTPAVAPPSAEPDTIIDGDLTPSATPSTDVFGSDGTAFPSIVPEATTTPAPVCFPASATVELADGSVKRMDAVRLGDRVRVGANTFSDVFMFTHKMAEVEHAFVTLTASTGAKLSLTEGHFMYVNGGLAPAHTVRKGDAVELADGSCATVSKVETTLGQGLYNPQTEHGDIVVDGFRASTYTTAVNPGAAHALLAPFRSVYESLGLSSTHFDAGAARLAGLVNKVLSN